jgi:hypothetical protein
MSKLSNLSNQDIHNLIEAMQNGIAVKPNGEEAEALKTSINRAYAELERRAQKKSQDQPVEKSEQLQETEKIKRAVLNPSNGIAALNETPEKLKADKLAANHKKQRHEFTPTGQTTYIGNVENEIRQGWSKMEAILSAPTKANQITIPVLLLGWETPKEMNQAEIKAEARRYFQAVFTSKKFKKVHSDGNLTALWEGKMYCNLWALCEAYNIIAGYRLEMEQLLNSYWSFSDENKTAAVDLAKFLKQPQP